MPVATRAWLHDGLLSLGHPGRPGRPSRPRRTGRRRARLRNRRHLDRSTPDVAHRRGLGRRGRCPGGHPRAPGTGHPARWRARPVGQPAVTRVERELIRSGPHSARGDPVRGRDPGDAGGALGPGSACSWTPSTAPASPARAVSPRPRSWSASTTAPPTSPPCSRGWPPAYWLWRWHRGTSRHLAAYGVTGIAPRPRRPPGRPARALHGRPDAPRGDGDGRRRPGPGVLRHARWPCPMLEAASSTRCSARGADLRLTTQPPGAQSRVPARSRRAARDADDVREARASGRTRRAKDAHATPARPRRAGRCRGAARARSGRCQRRRRAEATSVRPPASDAAGDPAAVDQSELDAVMDQVRDELAESSEAMVRAAADLRLADPPSPAPGDRRPRPGAARRGQAPAGRGRKARGPAQVRLMLGSQDRGGVRGPSPSSAPRSAGWRGRRTRAAARWATCRCCSTRAPRRLRRAAGQPADDRHSPAAAARRPGRACRRATGRSAEDLECGPRPAGRGRRPRPARAGRGAAEARGPGPGSRGPGRPAGRRSARPRWPPPGPRRPRRTRRTPAASRVSSELRPELAAPPRAEAGDGGATRTARRSRPGPGPCPGRSRAASPRRSACGCTRSPASTSCTPAPT